MGGMFACARHNAVNSKSNKDQMSIIEKLCAVLGG